MQLPYPAREWSSFTTLLPPMVSSNPWTYLSLKASSEWEMPTALPRQTSPSSKPPPAPFILLQTKRQREQELRALNPEASSTLITFYFSSPLQIWRFFPFAAVPTLSWGPQKRGQTAAAFCRKGHLLIACQVRDNVHPLRKADIISSAWHLHSALEHSYVNVQQSGMLFKSCKPSQSQEGNTFKYLGLCT